MPASPTATPEHIKDVNTRYHDAAADEYDAKWGIDFGAIGQAQVRLKLAKALGGRDGARFGDALEIGSGTGYFSLNLLQLGRDRAADRDRHLAGDAGARSRATAEALGLEVDDGRAPRPRSCPSRTRASTSSSATPSSTTSPTSSAPSPSSAACCARAARSPSPASPRATATASRRCRSAPGCSPRRPGGALIGARRARRRRGRAVRRPRARGRGRRPRLRPRRPAPPAARRRLRATRRVGGEELLANAWGWGLRTVEASAEPESVSWGWRQLRLPQLHRPAEGRHPPARAPPARPSSSTTCSSPAASRPSRSASRGGRGRA